MQQTSDFVMCSYYFGCDVASTCAYLQLSYYVNCLPVHVYTVLLLSSVEEKSAVKLNM